MNNTQRSLNYFSSNAATLTIHSLNDLNLTINGFPLPGITLPSAVQPTPFRNSPIHGDKLEYEDLSVNFLVNEDLSNWIEVHNWMRGLAAPEEFPEFANRDFTYSEGTAIIYSSHNNPQLQVKFRYLVPISLSSIEVTEEDSETVYKIATATFSYERYDIVPA